MLGKTAKDHGRIEKKVTINAVDIIRAGIDYSQGLDLSPLAMVLCVQLCSLWDNREHTGVINPSMDRLCAFNNVSESQLRMASLELAMAGLFSIVADEHGKITLYTPLFLERLGTVQEKERLSKALPGPTDTLIWLARYSKLGSTARTIILLAVGRTRGVWCDLGWDSLPKNQQHRTAAGTRQVRKTLFKHPMLKDHSPTGWAKVANMLSSELTEEMVQLDPIHSYLPVSTVMCMAGEAPELDILELELQEIFTMTVVGNQYRFTPTLTLHMNAWWMNRNNSGAERTDMEVSRGFYPETDFDPSGTEDAYLERPPLGFHWLYEIRVGGLYQIGESTQALHRRLNQHLQNPTNTFAEKAITESIRKGELPTITCVAMIHAHDVARKEMELLQYHLESGHDVLNWITDARENRRTIKQDSRFDGWSKQQVKDYLNNIATTQSLIAF